MEEAQEFKLCEKVEKKITSWIFSSPNQADKLIFCNSILPDVGSHIMSVFLFPKRVMKKLDCMILRLLWIGGNQIKPTMEYTQEAKRSLKTQEGKRIKFQKCPRDEPSSNIQASVENTKQSQVIDE